MYNGYWYNVGSNIKLFMNKQITTTQDIKKKRIIELWRETRGHVSNTCRAVPITRKTFYSWLKKDQKFAQALVDAEAELNDDVRDALIQKIADGDMTAIIFYLKKRHPDFKDKKTWGGRFSGDDKGNMKIEFIHHDES